MDNPHKPVTLGTQDTERRQSQTHNKGNYKDEQYGPRQKPGVNPTDREGKTGPAPYSTPAMFLMY